VRPTRGPENVTESRHYHSPDTPPLACEGEYRRVVGPGVCHVIEATQDQADAICRMLALAYGAGQRARSAAILDMLGGRPY